VAVKVGGVENGNGFHRPRFGGPTDGCCTQPCTPSREKTAP
jgi:hypothetical protein